MKRHSIENTDSNQEILSGLDIEYGLGTMRLRLYFYITNADLVALKELIQEKQGVDNG